MKPLRAQLEQARKESDIPWEILERDYLLSWILSGISRIDTLRETLVFKGGTALKKCWFGDYRFSEDLDFSAATGAPIGDAMEEAVATACRSASQQLEEYAPVSIACQRYHEKQPHPAGQEAFIIRAKFPWQRSAHTRVMIEISVDEPVLKPTLRRNIIHAYNEQLSADVLVYALEEIVAEKLRAILQHAEKFEERGWSRSRARDYYDLWRVLGTYKDRMNLTDFKSFLRDKCAVRGVSFDSANDFFKERMIAYVQRTWNQWLGPLVPDLPSHQTVFSELRPQIDDLLASA